MTKMQMRRGTKAQLTAYGNLSSGEFGYCTDTFELYIGNASGGNTLIGVKNPWGDFTADIRTAVNLAKTTAQTLVSATNTKITFQSEYTDALAEWDTTNNRFTPKVTGRYLFIANLSLRGITAGCNADLMLVVNTGLGNQSYEVIKTAYQVTTAGQGVTISSVLELGTTDFVELFITASAALTVEEFPERNYMKIQRLA